MSRNDKGYSIGYYSKERKEFVHFQDGDGRSYIFSNRADANRHIRNNKIKFHHKETVVVEVVIKGPKFKHEMTLPEIEKALGKRIIIVD